MKTIKEVMKEMSLKVKEKPVRKFNVVDTPLFLSKEETNHLTARQKEEFKKEHLDQLRYYYQTGYCPTCKRDIAWSCFTLYDRGWNCGIECTLCK